MPTSGWRRRSTAGRGIHSWMDFLVVFLPPANTTSNFRSAGSAGAAGAAARARLAIVALSRPKKIETLSQRVNGRVAVGRRLNVAPGWHSALIVLSMA